MKKTFVCLAALGGLIAPAAASAQETVAQPFVGVSVGYHDLSVEGEVEDAFDGFDISDSGPIIGVVAGVDVPVGSNFFVGAEANYHFGTDVIDSEYGIAARAGFVAEGGAKFFVRGGYQEIDIDPYKIVDVDVPDGTFDGLDTSDGDYLVGVGVEYPIGTGALRFNVDSVSFDTLRATTGYVFKF